MPTALDKMNSKITLHGLGFIQIQLEGEQRLHVWHPDLPRRSCFRDSAIHDHRFGFLSRVLVGEQINIVYDHEKSDDGQYVAYSHEGQRSVNGGRPWNPDGRIQLTEHYRQTTRAGSIYKMEPYVYHQTEPGGNGKVATIMHKYVEYTAGAHSTCTVGVQPDADFNRFQLSRAELWKYVEDVLLGGFA